MGQPQLHNATPEQLVVDWEEDVTTVRLYVRSRDRSETRFTFERAYHLTFGRTNPWGPSAFIKSSSFVESASGIQARIEMQSGDVVEVHATRFTWNSEKGR